MKSTAGVGGDEKKDLGDSKRKAANDAINSLLFTEALTKKEIAKRALEKAAAKEKAAKAKEDEKEPEKRDIYTDSRDKNEDSMENWDEEKLREAVTKKMGGQGQRCQTDIICKHFLDAVEKRTYGWFWECPNGGDKCQYRHALPEGFVLKRDRVNEVIDMGPTLEETLEEERKQLMGTRTPVTFERLQEWLKKKNDKIAEEEAEKLDAARKQYAKGKVAGVTGRMLFEIDSSLFVDDASGMENAYTREESDDEDDADGEGGAKPAAAAATVPSAERPPPPPPDTRARHPADAAAAEQAAKAAKAAAAAAAAAAAGGASAAATCGACEEGAAGGGSYAQNYSATPEEGGGGETASGGESSGAAPAIDVSDLAGVDESLFLDDDLPDDDDLE